MRSWLPTVVAVGALAVAAVAMVSAHRAHRDVDRLNDRVSTLEQAVGEAPAVGLGSGDLESRVSDLEAADLDGRIYELEQNIDDICTGVEDANTNSATEELIDNIISGCP